MTSIVPRFQLLPSAIVQVFNGKNELVKARILLDTGATANFVTQSFADKLGLPHSNCKLPIAVMNSLCTSTKSAMKITLKSQYSNFQKSLSF